MPNLIEFPEQTVVIAKDQPQYLPLPAYRFQNDPQAATASPDRLPKAPPR